MEIYCIYYKQYSHVIEPCCERLKGCISEIHFPVIFPLEQLRWTVRLGLGVANLTISSAFSSTLCRVHSVTLTCGCDSRRARLVRPALSTGTAEVTFACGGGLVKARRIGESWRSARRRCKYQDQDQDRRPLAPITQPRLRLETATCAPTSRDSATCTDVVAQPEPLTSSRSWCKAAFYGLPQGQVFGQITQ